jgi:ribosomal protein S27AE
MNNRYLAKGLCQKCGAKEVIAHDGYKHLCQRCNVHLFMKISEEQKTNYMQTGHVSPAKINAK